MAVPKRKPATKPAVKTTDTKSDDAEKGGDQSAALSGETENNPETDETETEASEPQEQPPVETKPAYVPLKDRDIRDLPAITYIKHTVKTGAVVPGGGHMPTKARGMINERGMSKWLMDQGIELAETLDECDPY